MGQHPQTLGASLASQEQRTAKGSRGSDGTTNQWKPQLLVLQQRAS